MTQTNVSENKKRLGVIINKLIKQYPEAKCSLTFKNPSELLVSTILSAQCTDARVNMVTKDLFKKYKSVKQFAEADLAELSEIIRSTGFFRNKAKNIIGMANALRERHGGSVPQTLKELAALPGVGRKTANVVLGNAFGIDEGVVVDTHVRRITNRLAFTEHQDPVKIERDLMELIPIKRWTLFPHLMIQHGRAICQARKPKCEICPIHDLCPSGT